MNGADVTSESGYDFPIVQKDPLKDFGKRLKNLRESRNLSQDAVAAGIDVARNTITRIESDAQKGPPDAQTIIALARFFNLSTDEIIFGKRSGAELPPTRSSLLGEVLLLLMRIDQSKLPTVLEMLKPIAEDPPNVERSERELG